MHILQLLEHYILQAHFERNQYEAHRADGKKRLRPDAIPTLFSFRPTPKQRQTQTSQRGQARPAPPSGMPLIIWSCICLLPR